MISVSHCGKLGDFLLCLPVVSALYKKHGQKIHVLLPECFKPFKDAISLLEIQPCIERILLIDHRVVHYGWGGQPYQIDYKKYIDSEQHYSFGFSGAIPEYIPYVYAKQYSLDVDDTFKIELGLYQQNDLRCCTEQLKAKLPDHTPIDMTKSLLENARMFAGARERHCWFSGFAILMELAGLDFVMHGRVDSIAYRYFKHH